ncbi:hypothetical protein HHI36_006016 [Cryptolaemus montrouzieri]|uniref:Uncharacterized protein n=1 Tax=Cryptolaemus montrouzieri TaxID=559131 RepID=A0ABD2NW31_9CUCU
MELVLQGHHIGQEEAFAAIFVPQVIHQKNFAASGGSLLGEGEHNGFRKKIVSYNWKGDLKDEPAQLSASNMHTILLSLVERCCPLGKQMLDGETRNLKEKRITQAENKQREIWKIINENIEGMKGSKSSQKLTADDFKHFFSEMEAEVKESIPDGKHKSEMFLQRMKIKPRSSFFFNPITRKKIGKIILAL